MSSDDTLYQIVKRRISYWLLGCDGNSFHSIGKLAYFKSLRKYGQWRVYQMIEKVAKDDPYLFEFSPDMMSIRISSSHPTRVARTIINYE